MKKIIISSLFGILPIVLMGYSTGPPPARTGALTDGGMNCTACHRTFAPANSDPAGSVSIDVSSYTPGMTQTIKVTVSHPEAARWGFEITARLASDETVTAGTFAKNDVARVICDDGSARGSLAPCAAGQHEFAEHFDAPRTDPGAGFTFSVDWTPPATDMGDIIFYAAGNAANGDGTNNGDRIYTTVRRISPPCSLTQKPSIQRAANAASLQMPWNPGVLLSVFGAGFGAPGTKRAVTPGDIVSAKYPENLACMAVTVNGQNAPLTYVQPDQINLQMPQVTGTGPVTVVAIANPGASNELRSDPFSLAGRQDFAPALFTFDGKSAIATNADGSAVIADPAVFPGAAAARPGDTVVLYATGLGPMDPQLLPGDIAPGQAAVTAPATVSVGGITVPASDVVYVGAVPQMISGLQEVMVKLPAALADGNAPVIITAGGVQSAAGITIPVKK